MNLFLLTLVICEYVYQRNVCENALYYINIQNILLFQVTLFNYVYTDNSINVSNIGLKHEPTAGLYNHMKLQTDEPFNIIANNEIYSKFVGVFDFGGGICDMPVADISKFVEDDAKFGSSM